MRAFQFLSFRMDSYLAFGAGHSFTSCTARAYHSLAFSPIASLHFLQLILGPSLAYTRPSYAKSFVREAGCIRGNPRSFLSPRLTCSTSRPPTIVHPPFPNPPPPALPLRPPTFRPLFARPHTLPLLRRPSHHNRPSLCPSLVVFLAPIFPPLSIAHQRITVRLSRSSPSRASPLRVRPSHARPSDARPLHSPPSTTRFLHAHISQVHEGDFPLLRSRGVTFTLQ